MLINSLRRSGEDLGPMFSPHTGLHTCTAQKRLNGSTCASSRVAEVQGNGVWVRPTCGVSLIFSVLVMFLG